MLWRPYFAHVLVGEPVSTPDQVRGGLSPGHALAILSLRKWGKIFRLL
jgi:hypothetical protein